MDHVLTCLLKPQPNQPNVAVVNVYKVEDFTLVGTPVSLAIRLQMRWMNDRTPCAKVCDLFVGNVELFLYYFVFSVHFLFMFKNQNGQYIEFGLHQL